MWLLSSTMWLTSSKYYTNFIYALTAHLQTENPYLHNIINMIKGYYRVILKMLPTISYCLVF